MLYSTERKGGLGMVVFKKAAALILAAAVAVSVAACARIPAETTQTPEQTEQTQPAVLPEAANTVFVQTGNYLSDLDASVTGAFGGEWVIIGLARSGKLEKELAEAYQQAAAEYVAAAGSPKLHKSKCTDTVRVILALTAIGADVTNVGGCNLLEGLAEMDYVKKQGNNGPAWALIALDSGSYAVPAATDPEKQVSREGLVDHLLSVQCADGGWSLAGSDSDLDVTAMVLQALAPYTKDGRVSGAVERALTYLSNAQAEDGGFVGYGASTSETCAQVIVALTALGIDPAKDTRFIKNGKTVVDKLCGFAVEGGGFCHILDMPKADGVATEQGYYALTAYTRFLTGQSSLYDMTK